MTLPYLTHLAKLGATDLHPLGRRATRCLIDSLALQPGQRVLEIGCGTAATMVHVVVSEGVHVDGIDILPAMLRVAWRHARWAGVQERASLARASGTSLPFARASYDRVYTESVLGFQGEADAQAMLAQIWRVLRPGGRYVANEAIWKRSTTPGQVATIYEASFRDFGLAQASEQAWNVDDWLQLMERAGFRILGSERLEKLLPGRAALRPGPRSLLLTWLYRLQGYLRPRLLRQKWRYRRRLARHLSDGHFIESRLFVLAKR